MNFNIKTDDLGQVKGQGATPDESGDPELADEEHKNIEGVSKAAVEKTAAVEDQSTAGQPAHLKSDCYVEVEFAKGEKLQVKSKQGLCIAVKCSTNH